MTHLEVPTYPASAYRQACAAGRAERERADRVEAEAAGLRREIELRDLRWQEWNALPFEHGHRRESSDVTDDEWCQDCATPDADSEPWPCRHLLDALGLPDRRAWNRIEIAQVNKQSGDQMIGLLLNTVEPERNRLREALRAIVDGADSALYGSDADGGFFGAADLYRLIDAARSALAGPEDWPA